MKVVFVGLSMLLLTGFLQASTMDMYLDEILNPESTEASVTDAIQELIDYVFEKPELRSDKLMRLVKEVKPDDHETNSVISERLVLLAISIKNRTVKVNRHAVFKKAIITSLLGGALGFVTGFSLGCSVHTEGAYPAFVTGIPAGVILGGIGVGVGAGAGATYGILKPKVTIDSEEIAEKVEELE